MKRFLVIMIVSLFVSAILADIIYVGPNETNTTIQAGVNAAQNGDTVIVRDGVYYGYGINLNGVEVISENGPDVCIIDGYGYTNCFNMFWESRIDGFTIRNYGIGVYVNERYNTIHNCIFDEIGEAAIYSLKPLEEITGCIFKNTGGLGAIYSFVDYPGAPNNIEEYITNNLFYNIESSNFLNIMNIGVNYNCIIENNTFINNTTHNNSIWFQYGNIDFRDCIFIDTIINAPDNTCIEYCSFNEEGEYGEYTWLNNLYNTDPLITEGISYLMHDSPCIGSGYEGDDMGWKSFADGWEMREFHKKWNWISFPRLPRVSDERYDAETVVAGLEPFALYIKHKDIHMEYINPPGAWDHNVLYDFQSTLGYKMNMSTELPIYNLYCYGKIANKKLPIELQHGTENWIGYFHEEPGIPEIAFAEIWDQIKSIKHENWAKWRKTPEGQWYGYQNQEWIGLQYGEMVVVEIFGEEDQTFHWLSMSGTGIGNSPESSYFSFEKKADYIPVAVELDEERDALEVGIFIDNNCKGFGIVEDNKAIINSYILDENRSGDIEFVVYNGDRNKIEKIDKYCILNPKTMEYEQNRIEMSSLQPNYVVSFADDIETVPVVNLNNYPNPFRPVTTINYNIPNPGIVKLEIYNLKGQKVKTLMDGTQYVGDYSVTWHGKDDDNRDVSSGVYFYRLKTSGEIINKKMILMK